jgi:hypothetical protein
MPPYQPKVVVISDRTAQIAAQYARLADQLRHDTIDRIKAGSVANAAEQSGALKAAHYVTDDRGSEYGEAVAAALGKNPDADMLPEIAPEPNTSILAVAVEYAAIAEFYTGEANPGSHPYMTTAAESERPAFERAVRALGGQIT